MLTENSSPISVAVITTISMMIVTMLGVTASAFTALIVAVRGVTASARHDLEHSRRDLIEIHLSRRARLRR
eukprot:7717859-Pyramimonas_sp.AAC.1